MCSASITTVVGNPEGCMAAILSNNQSDYSMHMPVMPRPDQPTAARDDDKPAAPCWEKAQKRLNIFVRALALIERLGNGLGTLAFTWATVVLLGGFSTDLKGVDFWYATVIMFLEALRVFSRESRSDDEFLFKTTGSIRLKRVTIGEVRYYLSAGIVMVCLYGTLEPVLFRHGYLQPSQHKLLHQVLLLLALLALAGTVQVPLIVNHMKRHRLLQFIPVAAVLALGGTTLFWGRHARLSVVLVVASLLVGCLQYNLIGVCLRLFLHEKKFGDAPVWVRILVPLLLPVWIVVSVFYEFHVIGLLILLGTLLLGNIQIPVAVARIVIAWIRLSSMDTWMVCPASTNKKGGDDCNEHLAPTMKIFYSMVLSQGALYLVACMMEMLFSIRLRQSLARCCGFTCHNGKPIDFYYEYAYDKCMEDGVISPEDLNLTRFSVDSLNSKSRDTKFAALRVLNSLLSHEYPSKKLPASEITTSMKAVTTLVNMLGWTSQEHQDIRLLAAKITAEIAGDLRIVAIPGAVQMVSSLLDDDVKHNLLKQADLSAQSAGGEAKTQQLSLDDSTTRLEIHVEESGHQASPNRKGSLTKVAADKRERNLFSVRCKMLQQLSNMFFAPEENETCKVNDLLPVLGMIIITEIAHDLDNCAEISRATGLIPKIVGFINYTADTTNISEEQKQQMNLIVTTSLTLVARLASVEGEIGIALRRKILEQPFLLSYLIEILEDSNGCLKRWGAAMVIIAKLAMDDETRKNIGDFQVIIPKLMQTFLCRDGPSNICCDREVRMVAGEALAKLTKENTSYCSTIFVETRFDVIEDLKNMLQEDEYAYVAASLLSNLKSFDLGDCIPLPSTLRVVMAKMMNNKDDKQLEALLVLASQLYDLNLKQFANELESHTNARRLVKKLVRTLDSNQKPHPEYQRIRRATVEVAIRIVESCPHYTTIFREEGMVEALSKVETASLKVEKYKDFLGNAGEVVDGGLLLSDLVLKAKWLIGPAAPISALSV